MEHIKYEEYVKKELGIPIVDFSNIPPNTIFEIVNALEKGLKRFPLLMNMICAIGDIETINCHANMITNTRKNDHIVWEEYVEDVGQLMETAIIENTIGLRRFRYIGIVLGENLYKKSLYQINMNIAYNAKNNYHPTVCKSIDSLVYHEIGHVLDLLLDLSNDSYIQELITRYTNNEESKIKEYLGSYCLNNKHEMIAEMISAYICNPFTNDLVLHVGNYVEKWYLVNETFFLTKFKSNVNNGFRKVHKKIQNKEN